VDGEFAGAEEGLRCEESINKWRIQGCNPGPGGRREMQVKVCEECEVCLEWWLSRDRAIRRKQEAGVHGRQLWVPRRDIHSVQTQVEGGPGPGERWWFDEGTGCSDGWSALLFDIAAAGGTV